MIYYHQLDPFIIHFTGNFGLRWYSLAYILAIFFAYFAGKYLIKKSRLDIPIERLSDVIVFGAIGLVVGGRLGYCLFYSPDLLISFDKLFPYWGLLKVHQGGMASHGGMLGLFLAILIYVYRYKISLFSLADLGALSGAFGIFLGRIANFINGELYGRVIEGSAWLAVRFPGEVILWSSDPKLYKKELLSLKDLVPRLNSALIDIPSSEVWSEWVSKASVTLESVQGRYVSYICQLIYQSAYSSPVKELLEPLLSLRHPSQLYQSFLEGFLPFIFMSLAWLKFRKAGVISLIFIMSYLCFRVFVEFFRQPDIQIGFQILGLTRGQVLSLCFFILAFIYAYFVYKQEPKGFQALRK